MQSLTALERADLARAYRLWRACGEDWGPARQAALHLFSCDEPWRVHSPPYATFVAWHRAFLYFHERNLAYALNPQNPSFRLPYWQWDDLNCVKQAPFCGPSQPSDGNLYPNLNWAAISALEISDLSSLISMSQDQFIGELLSFHASIHEGLADDMRDPTQSAGDPIFYPFHVNFDRVMAAYRRFGPQDAQILPGTLPDMFFFDLQTYAANRDAPNKGWVIVKAADYLDGDQLGYSYDFAGLSPAFDIQEIPNSPAVTSGQSSVATSTHPAPGGTLAPDRPPPLRQIVFYDIALPDGTPGLRWRVSVSGSGKLVTKDFTMHMPDHQKQQAMEPSFPYLRINVTNTINSADFTVPKLQLSLEGNGYAGNLKARKIVLQTWTKR